MVGRLRSASPDLAFCGILGCLLLAMAGCYNSSSDPRLDKELAQIGQTKNAVFPLAGKVTVDGQPFQSEFPNRKVIVMLIDRAKPNLRLSERPMVECNSQGEFAFSTYGPGDGIGPGDYVIVFAQLTAQSDDVYSGSDGFHNLYNDPDKNGAILEFSIKHEAPGKTDYVFDLQVAGQEPVSQPGPRALTKILND